MKTRSLEEAVTLGKTEEVRTLLEAKADPNSRTTLFNWTLLHIAASGSFDIVKLLAEAKANVDTNIDGFTPLRAAVYKDKQDIVDYLLKANANPEVKATKDGRTVIFDAIGNITILTQLIEAKADLTAVNNKKETSLLFATNKYCMSKKAPGCEIAIIEKLIQSKADIEAKTQLQQTPLNFAALLGKKQLVELLIQSKANLEAKDDTGWTPLFAAVHDGHDDVVAVLIKAKANLEARSNKNNTPLMVAEKNSLRRGAVIVEQLQNALKYQKQVALLGVLHKRIGKNAFFAKSTQPSLLEPQLLRVINKVSGLSIKKK